MLCKCDAACIFVLALHVCVREGDGIGVGDGVGVDVGLGVAAELQNKVAVCARMLCCDVCVLCAHALLAF